ncbi:MAG: glycosyltransferase [Bacteroidales bacterium]|nr:glycosyltransferase [Candidatus Latescibacterota bacterium]
MKVVCFSEIQWQYVRTRKQQIIGRFPADWEILFLSSVVKGKKNNFRPARDGNVTHVCIPALKNFPQKLLRILFSFPPARFLWNIILFLWVHTILSITGFSGGARVFFVSNIYYAAVLPLFMRSFILYDCNDDPLEFPGSPPWAGKYFRKLVSISDVLVAVSRGLVERLHSMGVKNVSYIGNGVDYGLFRKAAEQGIPEEMKKFNRPVLGYSGAIAPWFDMELLNMVAESFPEASIVLMGPLFEPLRERLEKLIAEKGNVFYVGSKPYERLGAYINALDICMIPLQMNELMRMADPNKIYEYAAVEKPIVTYKFAPEMEELDGMIYLAESRVEFVEGIRKALKEGADSAKLRQFAMACSWQSRADAMIALIERRCASGDYGEECR